MWHPKVGGPVDWRGALTADLLSTKALMTAQRPTVFKDGMEKKGRKVSRGVLEARRRDRAWRAGIWESKGMGCCLDMLSIVLLLSSDVWSGEKFAMGGSNGWRKPDKAIRMRWLRVSQVLKMVRLTVKVVFMFYV